MRGRDPGVRFLVWNGKALQGVHKRRRVDLVWAGSMGLNVAFKKSGYIAGLDGWRALAILLVLLDHDQPISVFGHSDATWHRYGGWGVWLFFALSGFLVCDRILADEAKSGNFNAKAFYTRRFFRIQPAAWLYLIVIALLTRGGVAHQSWSSWCGAVFLYQNYLFHQADASGTSALTGHFWTLAVEEHFYLVLSLMLLLSKQHRVMLFSSFVAILTLWSIYAPQVLHYENMDYVRHTEFNLQYLLLASLFAILLRSTNTRSIARRLFRPAAVFALTAATLLIFAKQSHMVHQPLLLLFRRGWVWYYSFPLWVAATTLHPESWTTRLLEWRPLRLVGRLSYSLYLWHALFFLGGAEAPGVHAHWLLVLCERPWRYVATLAAATLSFYLVERPLQRYGHSLAPPSAAGHRDLILVEP